MPKVVTYASVCREYMLLKQWVAEEAERQAVTMSAIYNRLSCGKYEGLQFERINARTVFVKPTEG